MSKLPGQSSVERALALHARLIDPVFHDSPVTTGDSSANPEYDYRPGLTAYSALRAVTGSARMARRAGIHIESAAMLASKRATAR